MTDEMDDILEAAASIPKKVEVDGQVTESQPIPDLIALDKYLANKAAGTRHGLGIKLFKTVCGRTA